MNGSPNWRKDLRVKNERTWEPHVNHWSYLAFYIQIVCTLVLNPDPIPGQMLIHLCTNLAPAIRAVVSPEDWTMPEPDAKRTRIQVMFSHVCRHWNPESLHVCRLVGVGPIKACLGLRETLLGWALLGCKNPQNSLLGRVVGKVLRLPQVGFVDDGTILHTPETLPDSLPLAVKMRPKRKQHEKLKRKVLVC